MRKTPLYPKTLLKAVKPQVLNRTIVPMLAWKMITFILFIARALPGNRRKELEGRTELLLGPMQERAKSPQYDSGAIAAYAPEDGPSINKEEERGGEDDFI